MMKEKKAKIKEEAYLDTSNIKVSETKLGDSVKIFNPFKFRKIDERKKR